MHPVDVKPRNVVVPGDMPLSESGELTCVTCHDVHADYETPYGAPSRYLRRQEGGKAFCDICHRRSSAITPGHTQSLGEAHFRSHYVVTDDTEELDVMSKNCLSCHDGAFSTSVGIRAGVWTHSRELIRHDRGSHPIGIDYEATRFNRGIKTDLRQISQVDRRIRFFNGKIGCGSCHDPYSTIPKKLVMGDENSKLCFSCHIV